MADEWTCPQCNQENPAETRFCPHCGAANPAADTSGNAAPAGNNRRTMWMAIIGVWAVGFVVLAVGGGMWLARRGQPEAAVTPAAAAVAQTEESAPPAEAATPTTANTAALAPTATAPPTNTPAAEPTNATSSGASLSGADGDAGDVLALPTPTPKALNPPGDSWAEVREISIRDDYQGQLVQPNLAIGAKGLLYLAYATKNGSIFLTSSEDGGKNWSTSIEIVEGLRPRLIVDDGKMYLFFMDRPVTREGYVNLYVTTSDDEGETWRARQINETDRTVYGGEFADVDIMVSDDENLYVMWSGPDGAYFSRSENSGQNWSTNQFYRPGLFPRIVIDKTGALHTVWANPVNGDDAATLYYSRSTNQGETWTPPVTIDSGENNQQPLSLVLTPSNKLYVLVRTLEADKTRIHIATSDNRGETWTHSEPLGVDLVPVWSKMIIDPSGNLYVIGLDTPRRSIFFSRSLDDGLTWLPMQYIHKMEDDMLFVTDGGQNIVVDDDRLYAAWDETPDGEQATIYFTSSQGLTDEDLAALPTPTSTPPPTPKPVAAAPRPTPVAPPNCPAPGVQITSPASGTVFKQRNNFIIGTANIVQFHHWKIEYSTSPGGGWQYLLERDYPVENDKLMMLDAATVPRGPYGLRLTVVDQSGNYPEPCEVWFVNRY